MRRCSHPLVLIFSCSNYKPQESTVNNSSDAVNGFFCLRQRRIIFHLSVQCFSDHQMGKNLPFILVVLWILPRIHGDPRSNTVEIICSTQLEHNTTAYVPNFIAGMQFIADKIQSSGYGISEVGSGPDANFGFAQCYGDLSPLDYVLCDLSPLDYPSPADEFSSAARIRVEAQDSLNNHFKADPLIKNRAVLHLNLDLELACNDLERGFKVWRQYPESIIGFFQALVDGSREGRILPFGPRPKA